MLHHDDYIGKIIERGEIYEQEILESIPQFSGIVVDIGANIGTHSVYFAERGYTVYAFEPIEDNFRILEKNVKGMSVICQNIALGIGYGVINMKKFPENMGMCRRDMEGEEVVVRPLDRIGIANVGLIKIDVEGMEDEVILGGINTIVVNKPIIIAEMNKDLDSVLCPLGYIKYKQIKTNAIYIFTNDSGKI